MNPVDQLLLDSLMMQMELNKLKKPTTTAIIEMSPSGPVLDTDLDEENVMEDMYHEMYESPEMEHEEHEEEEEEEEEDRGMALVELKGIVDKTQEIIMMLEGYSELPAWCQAKITLASHDVSAVRDFMKYKNCK